MPAVANDQHSRREMRRGRKEDTLRVFRDVRPPEKADYDLTPDEVRLLKPTVEGHSYKSAATILARVAPLPRSAPAGRACGAPRCRSHPYS
jgi:hypothetical protein